MASEGELAASWFLSCEQVVWFAKPKGRSKDLPPEKGSETPQNHPSLHLLRRCLKVRSWGLFRGLSTFLEGLWSRERSNADTLALGAYLISVGRFPRLSVQKALRIRGIHNGVKQVNCIARLTVEHHKLEHLPHYLKATSKNRTQHL